MTYNALVIEDSRADFILVERYLARNGIVASCTQVSSLAEVKAQLTRARWDFVLCDFNLPGMEFRDNLELIRTFGNDTPVIVISGTIGEERAVELLKLGIADFILKGNMNRLAPAISRALREVAERRANRIAEQKIAEQAHLLDHANDAIIVRSLDNRILYWNRAAERQYGWAADEVLGRNVVDILYSTSKMTFEESLAIVMTEGDFSGRIVHRCRDGRKVIVQSHWVLVRDEQGFPKSILAIHTDITDRIELEERLFQIQKLDSLGKLTGGIAHDFNNLLTVILGNAELLEEELKGRNDLFELVDLIRTAGEKAADLTDRLLAFSRRQTLEPEVFKPDEIVHNMRPLLQRAIGEQIGLDLAREHGLWPVNADRPQFEAALLNLCINARDAMPEGGTVKIEFANARLTRDYLMSNPEARPGDYVMVSVSDDGEGMSDDIAAHAFEPFFTTKAIGKGSGLGLSMVYGFVLQSKGAIKLFSEVGKGTAIKFYLPRSRSVIEAHAEPAHTAFFATGEITILLVEDDDLVRAYGENILMKLGYKVSSARNGNEALELLRQGLHCNLLFTDVVMAGGMNGPQLAIEAERILPGLPVLFTSGYAGEVLIDEGYPGGPGRQLLRKPYNKENLSEKIWALLSKSPRNTVLPSG